MRDIFATIGARLDYLLTKKKHLLLIRVAKEKTYTIGRLYEKKRIGRKYICDTIEAEDSLLIPCGKYEVMFTFGHSSDCDEYNGMLPYIHNDEREVVIRNGRYAEKDVITVGDNRAEGKVAQSLKYFHRIMDDYMLPSLVKEQVVILKIKD